MPDTLRRILTTMLCECSAIRLLTRKLMRCGAFGNRHAASVVWDALWYLENSGVGLKLSLPQRFAVLVAAAVHDFKHP